jgi:hypothetical protein
MKAAGQKSIWGIPRVGTRPQFHAPMRTSALREKMRAQRIMIASAFLRFVIVNLPFEGDKLSPSTLHWLRVIKKNLKFIRIEEELVALAQDPTSLYTG